jgi:hypothetical protein
VVDVVEKDEVWAEPREDSLSHRSASMKNLMIAVAAVLVLNSTAYGGWYVGPTVGYAYYPPVPVYAYAPAPAVVAAPQVVYSPVLAAPGVVYAPAVPVPVVTAAPVWVAPPGVVIRSKVYIPGRPLRNIVRAVVP